MCCVGIGITLVLWNLIVSHISWIVVYVVDCPGFCILSVQIYGSFKNKNNRTGRYSEDSMGVWVVTKIS